MKQYSLMRKLSLLKGAFVILAICCNLLLLRRSSADREFDGTGEEVRDDRWGSSTADWQLISSSVTSASGPGVNTYMKSYPGTQLSAFRGVGTLDIHISVAMGLFCDFNLAYEWVAMLESIQSYPHNTTVANGSSDSIPSGVESMSGPNEYGDCQPHGAKDVVHQTLKIPWPISPREIVLEREFRYLPPKKKLSRSESFDGEDIDRKVTESESSLTGDLLESADDVEGGGVVIVRYQSIEDDRIPMHPDRVRAESPLTMWRFQDVTLRERALRDSDQDMEAKYTEIEVQVLVDSKGYIPVWFINRIQRLWPARAMSAFNKLIKAKDSTPQNNDSDVCMNTAYNSAGRCAAQGVKPFQPVAHW